MTTAERTELRRIADGLASVSAGLRDAVRIAEETRAEIAAAVRESDARMAPHLAVLRRARLGSLA